MYRLSIVFILSILPYALLQTEDPHLCEKYVTVRYTVTERTPLEDYGRFAADFIRLNIQGAMRSVVKTKLEARKDCCPGYEKSEQSELSCQPVQTTTESTTVTWTDSDEPTTMDIDIVTQSASAQQEPRRFNKWIAVIVASLVLTMIVAIAILSLYCIRRKRILNVNNVHENGNELEARVGLFSESLKD